MTSRSLGAARLMGKPLDGAHQTLYHSNVQKEICLRKMRTLDYQHLVSTLPLPSTAHYTAFTDHLCWAHSWYKHLPLLQGGLFVVYLAPDAGAGYPSEQPRLHYSWQTTEEYRQRFGYLDYMWRVHPRAPFDRDIGEPLSLPQSLLEACCFTLYPYVSTDDNALEAISYDIHADALEQLHRGYPHPEREHILAWERLHQACTEAWRLLTAEDMERAITCDRDVDVMPAGALSNDLQAYLQLSEGEQAIYTTLQAQEAAKIVQALQNLHAWLVQQGEHT